MNLDLLEEDNYSKRMAEEIIDSGLKDKLSEIWGAEATVYYPGKYAGPPTALGFMRGKISLDLSKAISQKEEDIEDYFYNLEHILWPTRFIIQI